MRGLIGSVERLVALDDERDAGPVGVLRQLRGRLAERRQRLRVPERDDLAPGFELAEEEEVVDELAHLLDLAAGALEQARDVRPRRARSTRAGRAGARAASAARARRPR